MTVALQLRPLTFTQIPDCAISFEKKQTNKKTKTNQKGKKYNYGILVSLYCSIGPEFPNYFLVISKESSRKNNV